MNNFGGIALEKCKKAFEIEDIGIAIFLIEEDEAEDIELVFKLFGKDNMFEVFFKAGTFMMFIVGVPSDSFLVFEGEDID